MTLLDGEEDEEPPPAKPRRANSAWSIFLSQVHGGKISSAASDEWKSLSDEAKVEYVEGAAAEHGNGGAFALGPKGVGLRLCARW